MKVKILSVRKRPFKNSDGEEVDYFWYKAERLTDGVQIEFGSMWGGHEPGEADDLNIVKVERANGRIGYKEVAEGQA